jgi:hypothetical protein
VTYLRTPGIGAGGGSVTFGTASGTAAEGNDSRIVGAAPRVELVNTFPTAAAGKSFLVRLVQDGTGSRLATWPATAKWPGGLAPTLSTGTGKKDLISFVCVDGTNWAGLVAGLDVR